MAGEVLNRLFKARDGAPLYAEYFQEIIPERLPLTLFVRAHHHIPLQSRWRFDGFRSTRLALAIQIAKGRENAAAGARILPKPRQRHHAVRTRKSTNQSRRITNGVALVKLRRSQPLAWLLYMRIIHAAAPSPSLPDRSRAWSISFLKSKLNNRR